jgi:Zn-finger nucleic acid-binding protein
MRTKPWLMETRLNCPKCNAELTATIRHKIPVASCPSCKGAWFSKQQFKDLEDEVFDLDEHAKGTLVFSSAPTTALCPECATALRTFSYRLYDLELEYCQEGHGYWLEDGQDTKVLELMKTEEKAIDRSLSAESKWASTVKHLHSSSLMSKIRDLFS